MRIPTIRKNYKIHERNNRYFISVKCGKKWQYLKFKDVPDHSCGEYVSFSDYTTAETYAKIHTKNTYNQWVVKVTQ